MAIVDKQRALLPLRKSIRLLDTFTVLEEILRNTWTKCVLSYSYCFTQIASASNMYYQDAAMYLRKRHLLSLLESLHSSDLSWNDIMWLPI